MAGDRGVRRCGTGGTFLANLVPWWRLAHPAVWLYGIAVALALVLALAALAGARRRDPLAPFGALCLLTLAVLGLDVMTGSRLQLDAPFGLSMIQSGRYYGIGNAALGIYGVTALFGAAWLGLVALRRYPRRHAVLAITPPCCRWASPSWPAPRTMIVGPRRRK